MTSSRLLSLLRIFVLAAASGYVGVYVVLALIHLRYPFELEWMEGGSVDHVRRILAGELLYVRPTLDFVPYIYTPLYFYLSAALSSVLGTGFFPLRLISFLASLGCITLIGLLVARETQRPFAGFVAGGLYASTYHESVSFFDIARVDSLCLFFFLGAIYVIRFRPSPSGRAFAGFLIALAFLTKQSTLVVAGPVILYVILRDRKRSWIFLATSIGVAGAAAVALDVIHTGWFRYYIFKVPGAHPWVRRMFVDFWMDDILATVLPASLLALLYLFAPAAVWQSRHPKRLYALAMLGALISSWLGRLHQGGWQNVLMPTFAMLAILAGLGIDTARRLLERTSGALSPRLNGLICVVLLFQFACVAYDPRRLVPTAEDKAAGLKFVETLRKHPGEIWLPAHGYLLSLAGKKTHAQEMALNDIVACDSGIPGEVLRKEVQRAIERRQFSAIIPSTDFYKPEIAKSYKKQMDLFQGDTAFWPVTGMRARPRSLFVPKPDEPPAPPAKPGSRRQAQ
jgi:hypothetical protein